MKKDKVRVQWYLPSPREVLVGHHFLSYPNGKKKPKKFRHQHYFHVGKRKWNKTPTLGPAFPVGPLGPLSPRGPWKQIHGIQMQKSRRFSPLIAGAFEGRASPLHPRQDGHLHANRGLLTQTYCRSSLSTWAGLS